MYKQFVILIALALFPISTHSISQTEAHNNFASATPSPNTDLIAEISEVSLDKISLILECPWTTSVSNYCHEKKAIVNVTVVVKNISDETFYYAVSGGRIIGKGASIVWDLTNEKPGKHSITVGVGRDYVIYGKTITKTVELDICDNCGPVPCSCPIIETLSTARTIKSDETVIFKASVSGQEKSITYQWTVSGGNIIAGQNTSQIMVKPNSGKIADKITTTVEIDGTDPSCGCVKTASATVLVEDKKP